MLLSKPMTAKHNSYVIRSMEQLSSLLITLDSKRYFNTIDVIKESKMFVVHCAKWVTLNQLFKFDCVLLNLINVILTDAELNLFLKAYFKNETSRNLEHLCLTVNHQMDINAVLDGFFWSYVKADEAKKLRGYEVLPGPNTNEGFLRIIMRNNEICYISISNRGNGMRLFYLCNFKDEVFQPFKLMKLPYLAMEQVIKNMSLMEGFNLSLCYPTLRYFVKNVFKSQKIKLLIQFGSRIQFRLESPNGTFFYFQACEYPEDLEILEECMRMKIGNASKIPFHFNKPDKNYLVTYWRDVFKGATKFRSLIFDLFNIRSVRVGVMKEAVNGSAAVDWINRMNTPIEHVQFDKGTVDDTLYSQIIDSENFHNCSILKKPSENFKSPEFRFSRANVNWQLQHSHWITLENFSDIGSACLVLKNLKLTDQEVNSLFKNLISGKFLNLELMVLEVNGRRMSKAVTLDGITDLENNVLNRDVRNFKRFGYNITVRRTIDVQMATGETCSFMFHRMNNVEEVQSGVHVFIWK